MSVLFTAECGKALRGESPNPQRDKSAGFALRSARLFSLASLLAFTGPVQAWPDHYDAKQSEQGGSAAARSQTGSQDAASAEQEDAQTFYVSRVDQGAQEQCLLCHRASGVAPQSGARLVLTTSPVANHQAFLGLLSREAVDGNWVLAKAVGQQNHGGGAVLSQSSSLYAALQDYFVLLGAGDAVPDEANTFWQGTEAEPREITLRRAALLFGGVVPSDEGLESATESEAGLRQAIADTLEGSGFKDFILRGANDRLLVEGLLHGINFDISTFDRYPELTEFLLTLPEDKPQDFEDYHDKPYLSRWDADWSFRWAISREPLELIAHVIMNDLPYTEILTADHTMVNAFSDLAYRSSTGFSHEFTDEQGFYDRSQYNHFVPGHNDGHIPHDREFEAEEGEGIISFSDYQAWPHAGVLSTQAWLARYPSTDTNRNRARARWTYFHFLGVDIERSAPRTMDPVALADTNNPTMKNSACTVCHERLDPVAGAYESFGDLGHYLDQYGGQDSLADSYKCPECYGGDYGSTPYEPGDTWYRDMRDPGFEGAGADGHQDSLQWLAHRIADDPRFAAATVRFWWPAVFGAKPLVLPEDEALPDYDAQLRAYNEQDRLIKELAEEFMASGFNAKALFTDMVMSRWYRHSAVTDPDAIEGREVELATVGRGRLLGPEELDRKNLAMFGRTWRQWNLGSDPHSFHRETALTGHRAPFSGFYGGIDGAVVTERNRIITPLMANLTETLATDLACQVVIEDFNRPASERYVFGLIERSSVPGQLVQMEKRLPGKVNENGQFKSHSLEEEVTTVAGPSRVRIADLTQNAYQSTDENSTEADLVIKEVLFKQGSRVVRRIEGTQLPRATNFVADQWTDDEGKQHWRGQVEDGVGWRMHEGAWVEFTTTLAPGDYQVEVRLGSVLLDNNVNDSMRVRVTMTATENIEQTASHALALGQIESLLLNALQRPATAAETSAMLSVVTSTAADARQRNAWFFDRSSHCDTWSIWPGEHRDSEWRARFADSEGMLRGWTALLHGILSSYEYLHD